MESKSSRKEAEMENLGGRTPSSIFSRATLSQRRFKQKFARPKEVKQLSEKVEQAIAKRINAAVRRCGTVHDMEEVMTLFVEGLDPATRTLLQANRANHHRATYLELIQQARYGGDSVRARSGGQATRQISRVVKPPGAQGSVSLMQSTSETESYSTTNDPTISNEAVNMLAQDQWGSFDQSYGTTSE